MKGFGGSGNAESNLTHEWYWDWQSHALKNLYELEHTAQ